jgi:hypothetical protein
MLNIKPSYHGGTDTEQCHPGPNIPIAEGKWLVFFLQFSTSGLFKYVIILQVLLQATLQRRFCLVRKFVNFDPVTKIPKRSLEPITLILAITFLHENSKTLFLGP